MSENLPVSFSNTRQGGLYFYVSIPQKTEYMWWIFYASCFLQTWFIFRRVRKISKSEYYFQVMSVLPPARPPVRPPARMEQLCSHLTDFPEIWYLSIFLNSVQKIRASLNSDTNNGYFTWRPIYIFIISLSILLTMRNISDTSYRGCQNTHYRLNICFKLCHLWDSETMRKNTV